MAARLPGRGTRIRLLTVAAALALVAACATAPVPVAEPPSPQPVVAVEDQQTVRELVVLLPEPDGSVGTVTVTGRGREVALTQPWTAAVARGPKAELSGPETLDRRQVERDFAAALGALPSPPARFILSFEKGTADLTVVSRDQLREIVDAIGRREARDVSVIGHADASGPEGVNVQISRKRAEKVADALVSLGVDREILEVGSHGSRVPLVPGGVDEPRNRRVEVTVR